MLPKAPVVGVASNPGAGAALLPNPPGAGAAFVDPNIGTLAPLGAGAAPPNGPEGVGTPKVGAGVAVPTEAAATGDPKLGVADTFVWLVGAGVPKGPIPVDESSTFFDPNAAVGPEEAVVLTPVVEDLAAAPKTRPVPLAAVLVPDAGGANAEGGDENGGTALFPWSSSSLRRFFFRSESPDGVWPVLKSVVGFPKTKGAAGAALDAVAPAPVVSEELAPPNRGA